MHVQQATASGASVVIQVGGDLYLSDESLSALWVRREARPGECPYPGLDAFGPGQAQWFFGRDKVTGDVLDELDDALRARPGGPVLVVGPSGAGKSSLLGAGLMGALEQGRLAAAGSAAWPRVMFTPGARPLATLREALARTGTGRVVIVADQLEEIFTACGEETERSGFLAELHRLAADGPAAVLLGLRADFYARATAYPVLRSAMRARQVVLGAMSAAEVRQAITLPASRTGLAVDGELVERLLRDLGVDEASGYEPGRLPLLAHALRATWARRDGDRLTVAGYEATGGIHEAIARSAEDVYAGLDGAGRLAARHVFVALVRVGEAAGDADGEGTADTRRRVSADSLYAQAADEAAARAAVAAFTAARLLTSGGQAVQITHEALLLRWPRLRGWIGEDRAGTLARQELEDAAAAWERDGRDPSGLYTGARLAAVQARVRGFAVAGERGGGELSRVAREFLTAADRRRRRGTRLRNAVIAVLAALCLALGALAAFAFGQRADAQDSFRVAEASVLAAQSGVAFGDDNPGPAMEFAVQGWRLEPTARQSVSALLSTQAVPFAGRLAVPGDTAGMLCVGYSPGGTLIATAGEDGYVRLWDAASHRQLAAVFLGRDFAVHAVAFSPDGGTLAASAPGGVMLWHVTGRARLVPAGFLRTDASGPGPAGAGGGPGGGGTVFGAYAVAFGPGGRTLAVANPDDSVQLWTMPRRALAASVTTGSPVISLAFAAQGRTLALATDAGAAELWDPARRAVTVLYAGEGSVGAVAVSPDGQTVAYAAGPATGAASIRLWSLASRRVTATFGGLGAYNDVVSLAFSPDGRLLAAAGTDNSVRLWDVRDPQVPLLGTLTAGTYPVDRVAFSPDGAMLAAASYDGSAALWNVRGNTLDGHADFGLATAFSPDGRLLAAAGDDPGAVGVFLYAMPSRTLAAILPTGGAQVSAIAFSPDGRLLAAALADPQGTVQLWDVPGRTLAGQLQTGQQGLVRGLAFSPDGRLLATSGLADAMVRLWDTARLSQVAALDTDPDTSVLTPGTWALAFSPDGRLLAVAGGDGLTLLYSVATQALVNIDDRAGTQAMSVAFSPDGRTVAIGDSDGDVYLYAVRPEGRASLAGGPFPPYAGYLAGSGQPLSGVAYAPDGQTIVAAGYDGTIRLWHVPTRTLAATISASAGKVVAMSYSGATGVVATTDGYVTRVWQTEPAQVAAAVCQALQAPVSQPAWSTYLPGLPYTPVCG